MKELGDLETKTNDLCNEAESVGYVEDNGMIKKYKELEVQIRRVQGYNLKHFGNLEHEGDLRRSGNEEVRIKNVAV